MSSSRWCVTREDAKAAFNLFCGVYGIGTLGMPANFARAGPFCATLALLWMAFANVYASIAISRVMLVAPPSVQTYSDLGEWVMGTRGRYAVVVSQLSVCLLVPCAFLVLGGTLLQVLFPNTFSQSFWIVFMAAMVLPTCLIPTLKEGAGVAFAGCLATLLSDFIAIGVLIHGMDTASETSRSFQAPDASVHQVLTTFGNLSLAYGAGIVIPDLQRQHAQPHRMPRVIGVTLSFISLLFLVLGISGYSAVGCRLSGNLLFSITSTTATGSDVAAPSPLGFVPHRGAVVMAYLCMQLHITIAFAVILHPAFYTAERLLGLHDRERQNGAEEEEAGSRDQMTTKLASTAKSDADEENATEDLGGSTTTSNVTRCVALRCAIVTLLVVLALALQHHFLELADFIGATCISLSCLILPLVFYVRALGQTLSPLERRLALGIAVVSALVGMYVVLSIVFGFLKEDNNTEPPPFPFCPSTTKDD